MSCDGTDITERATVTRWDGEHGVGSAFTASGREVWIAWACASLRGLEPAPGVELELRFEACPEGQDGLLWRAVI